MGIGDLAVVVVVVVVVGVGGRLYGVVGVGGRALGGVGVEERLFGAVVGVAGDRFGMGEFVIGECMGVVDGEFIFESGDPVVGVEVVEEGVAFCRSSKVSQSTPLVEPRERTFFGVISNTLFFPSPPL